MQINNFITSYNVEYRKNVNTNTGGKVTTPNKPEEAAQTVKDPDIKHAFYIDIKHIYDNWIAGNGTPEKTFTCCSGGVKSGEKTIKLYDMFKFVDKFRNQTAGDAIININSFNN